MDNKEYQGHANWATWSLSLHVHQDKNIYKAMLDRLPFGSANEVERFCRERFPDGTPDMDKPDVMDDGTVDVDAVRPNRTMDAVNWEALLGSLNEEYKGDPEDFEDPPELSEENFLAKVGCPELAKAVILQSGGWDDFVSLTKDECKMNANGWVWYYDQDPEELGTVEFFEKHRALIMAMAETSAEELGQGLMEMIASFQLFKNDPLSPVDISQAIYDDGAENADNVRHVMAVFAMEEVCNIYVSILEG